MNQSQVVIVSSVDIGNSVFLPSRATSSTMYKYLQYTRPHTCRLCYYTPVTRKERRKSSLSSGTCNLDTPTLGVRLKGCYHCIHPSMSITLDGRPQIVLTHGVIEPQDGRINRLNKRRTQFPCLLGLAYSM